ncbi:MAG: Cas10/Cmr2 second palm domain-containing protein [Gammaproteobacteria bacterium]
MSWYAYLFEAKSIQSFIFDSGKLRDVVGASELVDSLCGEPLDDALMTLGVTEQIRFSRRAGGAFYAFTENSEAIERLATFWPLLVQQYAPELDFDQAAGGGEDTLAAFDDAVAKLREVRSRVLVSLPQAGPRVHRSQRTGRPAVEVRRTQDGDLELLDLTTLRQRRFYDNPPSNGLVVKLAPQGCGLHDSHWPRDMESGTDSSFPFMGDTRYIAIMHADGNGLGQLLMGLREHIEKHDRNAFVEVFRNLSEGIENATRMAVQTAVQEVLLVNRDEETGLLPARPIVLGGDDLTILLRADLAMAFTRIFLSAFEKKSREAFTKVKATFGIQSLPGQITACAGIAYIKASQPFYLAARLAEEITASVKRRAKSLNREPVPSSLGFHRVTSAMIDDYEAVVAKELTTGPRDNRYRHTLGAYALARTQGLPALDDLLTLQELLEDPAMSRGPTRQLLTLIGQGPDQAQIRYQRWRTLMEDARNGKTGHLQRFDDSLKALLGTVEKDLPYCKLAEARSDDPWAPGYQGPLGDLCALIAVKSAVPESIEGKDLEKVA